MYMNIKFLHNIFLLAALFGFCLTSCSDDIDYRPVAGDHNGLVLMVPAVNRFASRAPELNSAELEYSSLYFFAFNQSASVAPVIVSLTTENSPLDFKDIYRSYPLNLEAGNYHFYLVANIWDADAAVSSLPQTEDAIKNLYRTFPDNFDCVIPEAGLPMLASHTDFSFQNPDGATTSMTTDQWFYYDGKGGSLYAVLTFMYAKITVVPQDAGGEPVQISDVTFSNLSKTEPVIFRAGYDYGTIATAEPTVADGVQESISFYIPERYVAEADAETQSSLNFKIGDNDISLPLGAVPGTATDQENTVPAADQYREIKRGTEYLYTLVTSDKIILEVSEWTPEIIATELSGPVYLHIEKQIYDVTAGEETPIWFESNAPNIRIESPKYTTDAGTTVNLYDYSVNSTQDTLRVWVNDEIPYTEYAKIKESINNKEQLYDFVHIVAGNIYKRITIYPLNLDNYLILNPESISIDVKLRVASGEYSGVVPVSIRSNYPNVKISLADGWDELPASDFGTGIAPANYPVKVEALTYDEFNNPVLGAQVTKDNPRTVPVTDGKIYYGVSFSGLNSGLDTWKTNRTLTFMVQGVDADGNVVENSGEYCTINIIPSILNYKIHFKPATGDWKLPHIYVYQCLEFPADYTQTFAGTSMASKPIGYFAGTATRPVAALEYSFTGALGFRGWEYPVNYNLLYKADGSPQTLAGEMKEGFFIFSGQNNSWDYQNTPTQAEARYNPTMDFCKEHRDYVTVPHGDEAYCPYCAWLYNKDGVTMNRMWPGIMMKPEGDGWFEFELTGIAEPGKTLIMFADQHGGSTTLRFPADKEVGMPLFDYPSREGWFIYNGDINDRVNNQFTSEKPVAPKVENYRIYWPADQNDSEQVHIWVKGGSGITEFYLGNPTGTSGGYKYYDFSSNISSSAEFGFIFHTGDAKYNNNGDEFYTPASTFTPDADGVKCAYFNGSTFVSGTPFKPYRIYWPQSMGTYPNIYLWFTVGTTDYELNGSWPGAAGTLANGYYYRDFLSSQAADSYLYFIFSYNDNKWTEDNLGDRINKFTFNSTVKRYCAYFNPSDKQLVSGVPN